MAKQAKVSHYTPVLEAYGEEADGYLRVVLSDN